MVAQYILALMKISFIILVCLIGLTGCATKPVTVNETDAEIEQSVLTVNRIRHQLWGEKLYPENLPCVLPGHTNCLSYPPQLKTIEGPPSPWNTNTITTSPVHRLAVSPSLVIIAPPIPQTLLSLVLTNNVTVVKLPFDACFDSATCLMWFDTGNETCVATNFYGVILSSLDSRSNVLSHATVTECYVPAVSECLWVSIPPGASSLKCEVFGPSWASKDKVKSVWSQGSMTALTVPPKLTIRQDGTNVILDNNDFGRCYQLESFSNGVWSPTPSVVPAILPSALYRLQRCL